ncbi:MAG: ATP-binding protein [Planctomycetaceae bacterium]|nr:ATP-binding protein [Planctomycetaceae bacterium]
MLSLLVTAGPDRGRSFVLGTHEPQLIGRSSEAVGITDPSVSRLHAELTPDGDAWRLRDLGSRHGTTLNGTRLAGAMPIGAGDRIRCGDTELLVLEGDGDASSLSVAGGNHERLALIGETVAALSHSIKNMLQGMRFGADAVDLALSRGDLRKAQEGWPVLQRNLDRVHALVLNMLAWAKERPLEPEPADLAALAREVRDLLAPAAGRRRVAVIVDAADGVPPVPLDSPALHQALTNLLMNAIEAAPERTGMVRVTVAFDAATDEAHVDVADNGSGIPDAVRARLFEPFVSSKGQRGTGLGLAVARKIAERHGGRLELVETSASGTRFRLALPGSGSGADPGETHAPTGSDAPPDSRPQGIPPEQFGWKFE